MKIKPIGSNQTELHTIEGTIVLFSYETPVAAMLPSGRYIKTNVKYSRTTSKHINLWLRGVLSNVEEVPQEQLDNMVKGVI